MTDIIDLLFSLNHEPALGTPVQNINQFQSQLEAYMEKHNLHRPNNPTSMVYVLLGSILSLPQMYKFDEMGIQRIYYKVKRNNMKMLVTYNQQVEGMFVTKFRLYSILFDFDYQSAFYTDKDISDLLKLMVRDIPTLEYTKFRQIFQNVRHIHVYKPEFGVHYLVQTENGIETFQSAKDSPYSILDDFSSRRFTWRILDPYVHNDIEFRTIITDKHKILEHHISRLYINLPDSVKIDANVMMKVLTGKYQGHCFDFSEVPTKEHLLSFYQGALSFNFKESHHVSVIPVFSEHNQWLSLSVISVKPDKSWMSEHIPIMIRVEQQKQLNLHNLLNEDAFLVDNSFELPVGVTTEAKFGIILVANADELNAQRIQMDGTANLHDVYIAIESSLSSFSGQIKRKQTSLIEEMMKINIADQNYNRKQVLDEFLKVQDFVGAKRERYLSSFILGQLLTTYTFRNYGTLKKYIFQRGLPFSDVHLTTFVLSLENSKFGIVINIAEPKKGMEESLAAGRFSFEHVLTPPVNQLNIEVLLRYDIDMGVKTYPNRMNRHFTFRHLKVEQIQTRAVYVNNVVKTDGKFIKIPDYNSEHLLDAFYAIPEGSVHETGSGLKITNMKSLESLLRTISVSLKINFDFASEFHAFVSGLFFGKEKIFSYIRQVDEEAIGIIRKGTSKALLIALNYNPFTHQLRADEKFDNLYKKYMTDYKMFTEKRKAQLLIVTCNASPPLDFVDPSVVELSDTIPYKTDIIDLSKAGPSGVASFKEAITDQSEAGPSGIALNQENVIHPSKAGSSDQVLYQEGILDLSKARSSDKASNKKDTINPEAGISNVASDTDISAIDLTEAEPNSIISYYKEDTEGKYKDNYEMCMKKIKRRKRHLRNCGLDDTIRMERKSVKDEILYVKYARQKSDRIPNFMLSFLNEKADKSSQKNLQAHLAKVHRYAGIVMTTSIIKDIIGAFINGDYKEVAINLAFLGGNSVLGKVSEYLSETGAHLVQSSENLLFGRMLKSAAPFLSRGASAFVLYDLVKQVKSYRQGNSDAMVGIVGDSLVLAIDVAEIGIEVAEAFDIIVGVSTVTGPLGAAIGAAIFVAIDVYFAAKTVSKIDHIIKLTPKEKLLEGFRAFLHIKPEDHIQRLINQKQLYGQLMQYGKTALEKFPSAKHLIFSYPEILCKQALAADQCTSSIINLHKKVQMWSRAWPDDIIDINLTCSHSSTIKPKKESVNFIDYAFPPLFTIPPYPLSFSFKKSADNIATDKYLYYCKNAFGISNNAKLKDKNTSALISIGNGDDKVIGFKHIPNHFMIGNGKKHVKGGLMDDTFNLHGNGTSGRLLGHSGENTLNIESFALNYTIALNLQTGLMKTYACKKSKKVFHAIKVHGMQIFMGRSKKCEKIIANCSTKILNSGGGVSSEFDKIIVPHFKCAYYMQIFINEFTKVVNDAQLGTFIYIIKRSLGTSFMEINNTNSTKHNFIFNYTLEDVKSIQLNETVSGTKLCICLYYDINHNRFLDLHIHTQSHISNVTFNFADNSQLKINDGNSKIFVKTSNLKVSQIIQKYTNIAGKLGTVIAVYSNSSNASVLIGHGKIAHQISRVTSVTKAHNKSTVCDLHANVLPSDPVHKTHLVGSNRANVFHISAPKLNFSDLNAMLSINKVTIYLQPDSKCHSNLDFSDFQMQITSDLKNSHEFSLNVSTTNGQNYDLMFYLTLKSHSMLHTIAKIRVKNILLRGQYKNFHVNLKRPMHLSMEKHKPMLLPDTLNFNKNFNIIIISENDILPGIRIRVEKRIEFYQCFTYNDSLIITNAFQSERKFTGKMDEDHHVSLMLVNFYTVKIMQNLEFEFLDKRVDLAKINKKIAHALPYPDNI